VTREEQEQEDSKNIRQWLETDGQLGLLPEWYTQLKDAQALHCPPWELDEVYHWLEQASRLEWVKRSRLAQQAEHNAQRAFLQRQRGVRERGERFT
jgi:hypothetical protein